MDGIDDGMLWRETVSRCTRANDEMYDWNSFDKKALDFRTVSYSRLSIGSGPGPRTQASDKVKEKDGQ